VEQRLRGEAQGATCPRREPACSCGRAARLRLFTRRAVRAREPERRANPRARSARLRAAERLPDAPGAAPRRPRQEAA